MDTGNNWKNSVNTQYTLTNTNSVPVDQDQVMGRTFKFTAASSHHFKMTSAVLQAVPFTMTCWYTSDFASAYSLVDLHASAASATRSCFTLLATGTTTDNRVVRGAFCTSSAFNSVDSVGRAVVGEWNHAVFGATSITGWFAHVNGMGKGTSSTSVTVPALNRTVVGARLATDAYSGGLNGGAICDARIYNIALNDTDVYAQWDPETRWDLDYQIGRVSYFFATAGGAGSTPLTVSLSDTMANAADSLAAKRIMRVSLSDDWNAWRKVA